MVTTDYVVQYILQKMGNDEKNYGIEWIEYETGYAALVHNVILYLACAQTRAGAFIVLSLFKDDKEAHIWEPQIHFSQAPIGKMLKAIAEFLRVPPPKGPQTTEEWERERLRVNLNKLFFRAALQTDLNREGRNSDLKSYMDRHKKMFREEGYWRYTEAQYETMKQELFRAVTRG